MFLLCNGNEISWVRSYLGAKLLGYEPVWVRTCLVTKSPDFLKFIDSIRLVTSIPARSHLFHHHQGG